MAAMHSLGLESNADKLARCVTIASLLQLIRKELKKCYKESGVNYQQKCRDLALVRWLGRAVGRPRQPRAPTAGPPHCLPAPCWQCSVVSTFFPCLDQSDSLPACASTNRRSCCAGVPECHQGGGHLPVQLGATRRAAVGAVQCRPEPEGDLSVQRPSLQQQQQCLVAVRHPWGAPCRQSSSSSSEFAILPRAD